MLTVGEEIGSASAETSGCSRLSPVTPEACCQEGFEKNWLGAPPDPPVSAGLHPPQLYTTSRAPGAISCTTSMSISASPWTFVSCPPNLTSGFIEGRE